MSFLIKYFHLAKVLFLASSLAFAGSQHSQRVQSVGAAVGIEVGQRIAAPRESFKLVSWNIRDFARPNIDLALAAKLIKDVDLLTLQEVNTKAPGRQAIERLTLELEKLNPTEDYCFAYSQPSLNQDERFAFIWKRSQIAFAKKGSGALVEDCDKSENVTSTVQKNAELIAREPAVSYFYHRGTKRRFHLASVHFVPSSKKPQKEVAPVFDSLSELNGPAIVAGDFNLSGQHPYFKTHAAPLGFKGVFVGSDKTSLRSKKRELASAYDNFFVRGFEVVNRRVVNLLNELPTMDVKEINKKLSDHCPIEVTLKPQSKVPGE